MREDVAGMLHGREGGLKRAAIWSFLLVWAVLAAGPGVAGSADSSDGIPEVFVSLFNKLIADGIDEDVMRSIFSDPRIEFLPNALEINIKHVEKPAHYGRFVQPAYVKIGHEFVQQYFGFMKEIEAGYGVPAEVITAILLVESDLGQKKGKYRVFNVLATVATADTPANIEANYQRLKERFPDLKREDVVKRAERRSRWAYKELVSLMRSTQITGIDPLEMKGSWAGAFGIPQFLPSSFLAYAADGNGDGVLDLNDLYDAVASVANYLKNLGWKAGMDDRQKRAVIWKYNHSELYVDAVLASAELIAQEADKR